MHPRLLCPLCLSFLPADGPLLLLPPVPAPLLGLWCPGRRLEVFEALGRWHESRFGLPVFSVRETAREEPVEMWFDSGPVRFPAPWLLGPGLSVRIA